MRRLLIPLCLFAVTACEKPAVDQAEDRPAAQPGPVKGVDRSHQGRAFPEVAFLQDDGDGAGEMTFDVFRGQPVLVNFWASWCAPCVKELPTLAALNVSNRFPGSVLPLNQDAGPQTSVRAFLAKHGVEELGNYQDPKMKVGGALGVEVLPTTILFDSDGREVWRYVGDLDWTGAEAAKLLAEADASAKG